MWTSTEDDETKDEDRRGQERDFTSPESAATKVTNDRCAVGV
jgi:hypothetical protein